MDLEGRQDEKISKSAFSRKNARTYDYKIDSED
jgi:hypothetical protein